MLSVLAQARALAAEEPVLKQSVPVMAAGPSADMPVGTYWGLQNVWPPFPYDPFPELPLYVVDPTNGVFLVDDRSVDYVALQAQQAEQTQVPAMASSMTALDASGPPSPGDGSDGGDSETNSFTPEGSGYSMDFGTNLWIADFALSQGTAVGMVSNTTADISYEIQYKNDLTSTQWLSTGFFILGSELTNWTALAMANVSLTNNAFFRIRSWASSDGSGLPDWWEIEYFGHTGLDPYSFDPSGDGFTLWDCFVEGLNPTIFNQPPAPQINVSFNANTVVATVTWLPLPGPVTGYTLRKYDWQTGQVSTNNFPANVTSFVDDLSSVVRVLTRGPQLYEEYRVQAHYANGDSAWGVAELQDNPAPAVSIILGSQGYLYLAFSGLPSDLAKIRVFYRADYFESLTALDYQQDNAAIGSTNAGFFDIPAANVTNGACQIPQSQFPPFYEIEFYVETVRSNGVGSSWADLAYYDSYPIASAPFVDARSQLKDNLRFLLRAATQAGPLAFQVKWSANRHAYTPAYTWPSDYVSADLYCSGNVDYDSFDVLRPLVDNFLYRNFIFDQNNLNPNNGSLTTGVWYGDAFYVTNYPQYIFDVDGFVTATTPVVPASLLTAAQTEWILPQSQNGNVSANAQNWYGLAYQSVEDAYITNSQLQLLTCYPGDSVPNGYLYQNVAQPVFQLADYYFARPNIDPMPQISSFSTTNTSDLIIAAVGDPYFTIAGYAKLALLNG